MPMLMHVNVGATAQSAQTSMEAEGNDHHRDAKLQPTGHQFRNSNPESEHYHPDDDERQCMPCSPQTSDERRPPKAAMFADDGRDGDDVIHFCGMFEAEDKPNPKMPVRRLKRRAYIVSNPPVCSSWLKMAER